MNLEPREVAATESYPTFWDETPPQPEALPVPAEEAYTTFVNLTEDEFPSGEFPTILNPDANRDTD